MKKVYFIYVSIPERIFNKVKYMLGNTEGYRWKRDKMFGLYAWTTNKAIASEFFEVRNKDIYTLVKKEIDEDELKHIKDMYYTLKLDHRIYYLDKSESIDKSVEIVSTKNEYVCVTEEAEEYMWEFGPQISENVPYEIFNDKVLNALDTVGYCKGYDLRFAKDEQMESTSYNLSFGLTPLGNRDSFRYDNKMNVLIYLFNYFFYGDKHEDEE